MEKWDAYDSKLNKIEGVTLIRGEHVPEGYYVDYLCVTDVDKDSIVLQEGETIAFKWIVPDELRAMSRDDLATMRQLNFIEELT